LVLYRYGGTGTLEAVRRAVDRLGMLPVYPVRSIHNFTSDTGSATTSSSSSSGGGGGGGGGSGGGGGGGRVFRDCVLVRQGTTVRELVAMLPGDLSTHYAGAETVGAIQVHTERGRCPAR
jgi:ribosome-binding ATPase